MKIKLKSTIADKVFEVDLYQTGDEQYGIKDVCLQEILYNELPEELGVRYDINVIKADSEYCAVMCTITDKNNRRIQTVNDINLRYMDENAMKRAAKEGEKEDKEEDKDSYLFSFQRPLVQVTQSVTAAAVRKYLKWPRVLANESIGVSTTISDEDVEIPPVEILEIHSGETEAEQATEEDKPETEDMTSNESNQDTDFSKWTLEELGKTVITSGTHKGKTLDQTWESNQGWFRYVEPNKSPKYDVVREYLRRK